MDASIDQEEGGEPIYKKMAAEHGKAVPKETPSHTFPPPFSGGALAARAAAPMAEDDDEDEYEYCDDDDSSEAGQFELPDMDQALQDPLFIAQVNYLLNAARSLHSGTELIVSQDAADLLAEWVYEHAWVPRKGFATDYDTDPSAAAPDFVLASSSSTDQ